MDARSLSVAVVGPGAIGTVVAAALHDAGRTPLLAGRTPRDALLFDAGDGRVRTVPGPVRTDPAGAGPVDLVLLAVKATQTAATADRLRALYAPGTVVAVLQNGIEQVETVAPLAPDATVVPTVVWFPAVRGDDEVVRLRGAARISVPDVAGAARLRDALDGTLCAVEVTDRFPTLRWRKLLQNAAAGLMALSGRRSGMFAREDIAALTIAYLRESLAVARAEGAELDDDEPERLLAGFRASPPDAGTSILADREHGLPLEWEARNGVLGRRARRHGIPTPLGDAITALLAATSDGPG